MKTYKKIKGEWKKGNFFSSITRYPHIVEGAFTLYLKNNKSEEEVVAISFNPDAAVSDTRFHRYLANNEGEWSEISKELKLYRKREGFKNMANQIAQALYEGLVIGRGYMGTILLVKKFIKKSGRSFPACVIHNCKYNPKVVFIYEKEWIEIFVKPPQKVMIVGVHLEEHLQHVRGFEGYIFHSPDGEKFVWVLGRKILAQFVDVVQTEKNLDNYDMWKEYKNFIKTF